MKLILRSFKYLLKFKQNGMMKVALLGLGLAVGLTLIAKVYFEYSYEYFIKDIDRTYRILPVYKKNGKTISEGYANLPGGVAPLFFNHPSVEVATRYTVFIYDKEFQLSENSGDNVICKKGILADSSFFDAFPRQIVGDNPKNILSAKGQTLVSRSFAQRILGGKSAELLIGKIIEDNINKSPLNVAGIYEDFPSNSELKDVEMIISLPSISNYMYDGTNQLLGNDRYSSFIKIRPGAIASQVEDDANSMLKSYLPQEQMKELSVDVGIRLASLDGYHSSDKNTRKMMVILSLLAVAVILVSVFNYILITLSALVRQAKVMAVRRCYGAGTKDIFSIALSDAFAGLILSLAVSSVLILALQTKIETLIGSSLESLVNTESLILIAMICVVVMLLCGFLPGFLYTKIPLTSAFKRYKENNHLWKHGLLFLQFAGTGFFVSLLVVVMFQYHYILNSNMGYNYDNVVIINTFGAGKQKRSVIVDDLKTLAFVKNTSFSYALPLAGFSGNNSMLPASSQQLFNIADAYATDENYFSLFEIPIIDGRNFSADNPMGREVIVSRSFVEEMKAYADWSDGAVGKQICVTEHSEGSEQTLYTICGVTENILIGDAIDTEYRPVVYFFNKTEIPSMADDAYLLSLKLSSLSSENMEIINDRLKELSPDFYLEAESYADKLESAYAQSRRFRDMIFFAGLVVLVLTIIGLVAYTNDNILRRRSEIAIRKINGASLSELMMLFVKEILGISGVGIAAGVIIAYFISSNWLQQFSLKISLNSFIFIACFLTLMLFISGVVLDRTFSAANANPVKNLMSE